MVTRKKRINIETETKVKPIIVPARYAHLKAYPNDILAQRVVLKLENVAICIPKAPQLIEVIAPRIKAKAV